MARITRVKSAQQRYATKPVLDAEGNQVYRTRKLARPTKRGKTETQERVTERDLTKPLPPLSCDFPGCEIDGGKILPGTAYMWIKPKSGPYGGHQKNRHQAHPAWHVWDYSYSMSARVAQIEYNATNETPETVEDAEQVLADAADEIRSLAEEKRESAGNIEDGFGHATYQSDELNDIADQLDGWADDVEGTEVPSQDDYRSEDQVDCEECDGSGEVDNPEYDSDEADRMADEGETYDQEETTDCDECGGTGQVDPDPEADLDDDALGEWKSAVQDAISEALGNCPV